MADKMENILGKTLCPKCDQYILIESIKEHQRVGCRVPLEPTGLNHCHMCSEDVPVELWPEHYIRCKLNWQKEDIINALEEEPGHYESIGQQLGALVDRKNKAYGDSFHQAGKCLEAMYPCGVPVSKYTDMLGVIRVLDKLFRIAKDENEEGESPWNDVAGYGLLKAKLEEEK